jgi:hypothetical protein
MAIRSGVFCKVFLIEIHRPVLPYMLIRKIKVAQTYLVWFGNPALVKIKTALIRSKHAFDREIGSKNAQFWEP